MNTMCWYAKPQGSQYWQRDWCKTVEALPADATEIVRAWDKGYVSPSDKNRYPDYTACIKMCKDPKGYYYIVGDFAKTSIDWLNIFEKLKPTPFMTINAINVAPDSNITALMICTHVVANMPPNIT